MDGLEKIWQLLMLKRVLPRLWIKVVSGKSSLLKRNFRKKIKRLI
jgi:hypothetical protein